MSEASLQGKLKYDVEYKAPVDKIHEFWSRGISDLPKISPNIIQNIQLVEVSWGNEGCIHNGLRAEIYKLQSHWRHILDYYRSFKFILDQVTPKGNGGSLASWTLEYEKLSENVPDPISLRDESVNLNKAVSAYLSQA
ncbi:hypothetical protein SLEP1_g46512 [Rubroshorea leprosula]|uniref:Bet v I/Major latex protein domain-containing protein n=1 Tax=Rubroshorea leprosula TaxID=152421 RepID=A0AAV5LN73_9ROSI|nr:hypothetical protein SLEP1_g46512 [Rubroshorea leprosula]